MNPMMVAQARTARLVREANTPIYSTDTVSAAAKAKAEMLAMAERSLCTDLYCFVCSRATDHFGEHSDEQIEAAHKRKGGRSFGV